MANLNELEKTVYSRKAIKGTAVKFLRCQRHTGCWPELQKSLLDEFRKKKTSAALHEELTKETKFAREHPTISLCYNGDC